MKSTYSDKWDALADTILKYVFAHSEDLFDPDIHLRSMDKFNLARPDEIIPGLHIFNNIMDDVPKLIARECFQKEIVSKTPKALKEDDSITTISSQCMLMLYLDIMIRNISQLTHDADELKAALCKYQGGKA